MKKTQNRIISPHAGWRLCLYVMLVMFASCKSCKKEINLLPDETQTGANTFGCLVDGKAWIPTGLSTVPATKPVSGGYISALPPIYFNTTNVWLRTYKDDGTSFVLYLRNVDKIGTYPLNFDTQSAPTNLYPQNCAELIRYSNSSSENYITTSVYTGSVEITRADPINLLLSGRFSFTGVSNTGKTINVTDGRFDINQRTQ